MSDNWAEIDCLKFQDKISVGSASPSLKKTFVEHSPIACSLYVTNNFLKELFIAHKQTNLRYLDIVNSQLSGFQIQSIERIESRFSQLCYRVNASLNTRYKGGRKREKFLTDKVSIAVYQNELVDVKTLSFTLEKFNTEQLLTEKRCADLFSELCELQAAHYGLLFEKNISEISENKLKRKVSELKNDVSELQSKTEDMKLKDEMVKIKNEEIMGLKDSRNELFEQNQKLKQYIHEIEGNLKWSGFKHFDDIEKTNKSRVIREFTDKTQNALWFAESFGLLPKTLKCISENGRNVNVNFNFNSNYTDVDHEDKRKLREVIYLLDKFCVSDAAYHELSVVCDELPRSYLIVQERANLDNLFHIERCPGNVPGVYVSLNSEIATYIRTNKAENTNSLKIKVSGDGTKVSRISNFVTLSMSFPDEVSNSADKIKTVAILKCKENYEMLSVCCSPIIQEFNQLVKTPIINVNGKEYVLDIFFGGDMKWIQIFLGLCGATGNYACPWCHVSKVDRTDLTKEMMFYESREMKRTSLTLAEHSKTKTYGSKYPPLIEIDPCKIVPDELHLLLRVSDILLTNIIDDCRQQDAKLEVMKKEPEKLKTLISKINECGVVFQTWSNKAGDLEWTSLTGTDYKLLHSRLPDKLLFVINNDTHDDVVYLLREFHSIHEFITKTVSITSDKEKMFQRIKNWMLKFQSLSSKGRLGYNKVTPYMHCFMYHIPSFIDKYGKLGAFSGQSVEKLNDSVKLIHQKKGSKQNQTYDELVVRKRIEFLKDENFERQKNKYTKKNERFWEEEKREISANKKRKILNEINLKHEKYLVSLKENEKPLQNMTEQELKDKIKSLGIKTRVRNKQKLISLINEHINQEGS